MDDRTRSRLYEAYASNHAGVGSIETSPSALRDVISHLPIDRSVEIVDIGCGQGELLRAIARAGYTNCRGIDVSPEQVELAHEAGSDNVDLGDYRKVLTPQSVDVVVATDFFEHLTKNEVVESFDHVIESLRPGGRLIARVPNAVSPFGGNYRHGDLTHETSFTPRSLQQLGATVGFQDVAIHSCPPIAHGLMSSIRLVIWTLVSSILKLALAAETGVLRGNHVTQNIVAVFHKPCSVSE